MRNLNQRGVAHLFVVLILLAGLAVGVFLIQKPTNLKPKASGPEPTGPQISLKLSTPKTRIDPGDTFTVNLVARSDLDAANLFSAKLNYPKDLLELITVTEDKEIITRWVEQFYDNNLGEVSYVGGITEGGYKSTEGQSGLNLLSLTFKAKTVGSGTISVAENSSIHRKSDGVNILTFQNSLDMEVANTPTPSPTPSPTPTPSPSASPSVSLQRHVRVTYPNGGEKFNIGDKIRVTWESYDIDLCYLGRSMGVGSLDHIADINNANLGYYDWTVEAGFVLPGAEKQLKMDLLCYKTGVGSVKDQSDNFFTVVKPAASQTPSPSPTPSPTPTPPAEPCELTSANWESPNNPGKLTENPVKEGDAVMIRVKGNIGCNAKKLNFTVKQNNTPLPDGNVNINPSTIYMSNDLDDPTKTLGLVAWTAEFQNDGLFGLANPPEYYFIVKIEGENTQIKSSNPELLVNKLAQGEFPDGDGNHDGKVDLADLSLMFTNWNRKGSLPPEFDLNNDDELNANDYAALLNILRQKGILKSSGTTSSPSPSASAGVVASCSSVIVGGATFVRTYTGQNGIYHLYNINSGATAKLTASTIPSNTKVNWKLINSSNLPNGGTLDYPDPNNTAIANWTAPNNPVTTEEGVDIRGDVSEFPNPWIYCPTITFAVQPK